MTADTELVAVEVAKMSAVIMRVIARAKVGRTLRASAAGQCVDNGGLKETGPVEIAVAKMDVGNHLGAKDSIA
jgi:hypothetical protein